MVRSWLPVFLSVLLIISPQLAAAGEGGFNFSRYFRGKPSSDSATIQLARTLDDLEKKLNKDGTVVAKAPDIWGEARLTKHRQEFERQMAKELDGFEFRLNAAISRSDQALLTSALAIGQAISGEEGGGSSPSLDFTSVQNLLPGINQTTDTQPPQEPDTSQNSTVYVSGPGALLNARLASEVTDKGINIEPTIYLDQMARYLNHLHEIRRLNEGDDTADSPGYSLNLVRIPVSIMPGSRTQHGHGAEVTITATPHITEELLPKVFRQLVINDLVDLMAPPLRRLAQDLPELSKKIQSARDGQDSGLRFQVPQLQAQALPNATPPFQISIDTAVGSGSEFGLRSLRNQVGRSMRQPGGFGSQPPPVPGDAGALIDSQNTPFPPFQPDNLAGTESLDKATALQKVEELQKVDRLKQQMAKAFSLPVSTSRTARTPVSPSNFVETFGSDELLSIAEDLCGRLVQNEYEDARVQDNNVLHLTDVRGHLQSELEAAYDLLAANPTILQHRWRPSAITRALQVNGEPNPGPNQGLRALREDLTLKRTRWSTMLADDPSVPREVPSVTTSLAWAIVVQAALLNQRLIQDINQVSQDPDCGCMLADESMNFADTSLRAGSHQCQVFADYVRCRWPIHVFALDPQAQDQNVADSYSMRREMQLALAMSFAAGETSAQNMTRYVRRLELDMETIALNRTVAAFGHGADVFGWRFYPRVQSPPFESNHTVIFRDLIGGGPSKDDLRRSWEIEPGMRECTAIVLMPSFITHATFDVRGNFFPLGRHKHRDPSDTRTSIEDAVEMSHKIRLMENAACSIACEEGSYRGGEAQRLLRRVDQLAKKLPLQTVHARVPNENTFGGFEMFSSGVTDLAPELLDFYGLPGVDPTKDTEMFLVGNNFSVHDTQVIAGNRNVEFSLISRNVMKVKIPAGVQTEERNQCHDFRRCNCTEDAPGWCNQTVHVVDLHIATPYGVSQHLEIPAILPTSDCESGYRWKREDIRARYRVTTVREGDVATGDVTGFKVEDPDVLVQRPHDLHVGVPAGPFPHPAKAELTFLFSSPQLPLSLTTVDTSPTIEASFSPQSRSYVIRGTQYAALQKAIKEHVVAWQAAVNGAKIVPATEMEIHLAATIQMKDKSDSEEPLAPVQVDNLLRMHVKFEPKP